MTAGPWSTTWPRAPRSARPARPSGSTCAAPAGQAAPPTLNPAAPTTLNPAAPPALSLVAHSPSARRLLRPSAAARDPHPRHAGCSADQPRNVSGVCWNAVLMDQSHAPAYRLIRRPLPAAAAPRLDEAQQRVVEHERGPLLGPA